MAYIFTKGKIKSSSGESELACYIWTPKCPPRAIVQISHGMCEHIMRYEELAVFLCENGIILCGCDHLGHGESVRSDADFGYFGKGSNMDGIVRDQASMVDEMRKKYRHLPYIILGHGMGSFILRKFMTMFPEKVDGAVICGTNEYTKKLKTLNLLASVITALKGGRYRSKLLWKRMFAGYTEKCALNEGPNGWLTKDREAIKKYNSDPRCGFIITAGACRQTISLIKEVCSPEWYESVPQSMPTLIIAGGDDPAGDYGKGPQKVYDLLNDAGMCELSLKIYDGDRHEILNETDRYKVYSDLLSFIERVSEGVHAAGTVGTERIME